MKAIIKTFILATLNYLSNKSNKPKLSPLNKMNFAKYQTLSHFQVSPIILHNPNGITKQKQGKTAKTLESLVFISLTKGYNENIKRGILGYFGVFWRNFLPKFSPPSEGVGKYELKSSEL